MALDQNLETQQDDWSLDDLLRSLQGRLERILFRYQIPPQDSEDVLQEAVLTLIYKRTKIRDPEAWLVATLRNRCLMYWRSKRSRLYVGVVWRLDREGPVEDVATRAGGISRVPLDR